MVSVASTSCGFFDGVCIICEETLDDSITKQYGRRAQDTLIRCSKIYGDDVADNIEKCLNVSDKESKIHIHERCYTEYTHKRNVTAINRPLSLPRKRDFDRQFQNSISKKNVYFVEKMQMFRQRKRKLQIKEIYKLYDPFAHKIPL